MIIFYYIQVNRFINQLSTRILNKPTLDIKSIKFYSLNITKILQKY